MKRHNLWIKLSAGAVLFMAMSGLQAREFSISRAQQDAISAVLDDAQAKGYSGYALVNIDGLRVIDRAAGKQNIEANLANTANTLFDFGSNTKQFTAAAILKLAEAGKLALTQPLSDFFKPVSEEKSSVTIHQLLTHTGGFEESAGRGLNALSKADFLNQVLTSRLAYPVGERFAYSNIGYSLLAAIIEQMTGQSYEAYLQQAFFGPLNMDSTGYTSPAWTAERIATGYYRGFKNFGNMIARYREDGVTWNLVGNGGIQTTAADFEKWMSALQGGKLLSAESIKLMLSPHAHYPDSRWSYGYGWTNTVSDLGMLVAGHTGSIGLYWSDIIWVPQLKLSMFYGSNAEMPATGTVAKEIRNILLNAHYQPTPLPYDVYWETAHFISTHEEVNVKQLLAHLDKRHLAIADENLLNRVGIWASKQGNLQWAIALLEKNISLYPNNGNLYDSLADAYRLNHDRDNAVKHFKKALELAPNTHCDWCENARQQLAKLKD